MPETATPSVVGLFAGIGGIELGLHRAGFESVLLCEVWPAAQAVLAEQFRGVPVKGDIRALESLPHATVVTAGFPCQDLSQAGRTAGIGGANSGLVGEVFRLLDVLRDEGTPPDWLLLENVQFMLRLDRGAAMRYLTSELERHGFRWAYRVVDSRAFGLPQRRKRVVLVASGKHDPRGVLFADDAPEPRDRDAADVACGFYWTEGIRGLGWAVDAVPTLKGGSTIGIPSPPAIRLPHGAEIVLPEIRDAERLQGFDADWTLPAVESDSPRGVRWRLVGNAVSVPMAEWVGSRLRSPGEFAEPEEPVEVSGAWPDAAWGREGRAYRVDVGHFPVVAPRRSLVDFLDYPLAPLSERATAGFLGRTARGTLRFPAGFLGAVEAHLDRVRADTRVAA